MSTTAEMFERLREVEDQALRNELGLSSHEKECALRYQSLNDSLSLIKTILLWLGAVAVTGMAGILVKLQFFPGAS